MKAPIKERIVVLRYKRLSDEAYRNLCDAWSVFVSKLPTDKCLKEEKLFQLSFPKSQIQVQQPDWSKLSVTVDYPSRFWNAAHTHCVQFFKDCFSINLVSGKDQDGGSYEKLCEFLMDIMPFVHEHAKAFAESRFSLDYVNQLSGAQLTDFLERDGLTLSVGKLLNVPSLGPAIPGLAFKAPVRQIMNYGAEAANDPAHPYKLLVSIDIPEPNPPTHWVVSVTFRAEPVVQIGMSDASAFKMHLDGLHEMIRTSFGCVFNKAALEKMELGK